MRPPLPRTPRRPVRGAADLAKARAAGPDTVSGCSTSGHEAGHTLGLSSSAGIRSQVELWMVEDVEGLRTELKRCAFLDGEVLEDSHIEVDAIWIARIGATSIPKGKALGKREGRRVEVKLGETAGRELAVGWKR